MAVRKEHRAEIPKLRLFMQPVQCRSICAGLSVPVLLGPLFVLCTRFRCQQKLITLGLTQAEPAPVPVAVVTMPSESIGKPLAA